MKKFKKETEMLKEIYGHVFCGENTLTEAQQKRFKMIVDEVGSTRKLAAKTGVSQTAVAGVSSGSVGPSAKLIVKLAINAGFSIKWLLTGKSGRNLLKEEHDLIKNLFPQEEIKVKEPPTSEIITFFTDTRKQLYFFMGQFPEGKYSAVRAALYHLSEEIERKERVIKESLESLDGE